MISRSTYLVTCRRQAGSKKGWYMTGLLVQLWVQQPLPRRLSEGAHCRNPGLWVQLFTMKGSMTAHTLSPRSMNLMATCWPVLLSSASSTKPNVPLFKSLICRRAHVELSTVTTPYNMHPVMTTATSCRQLQSM